MNQGKVDSRRGVFEAFEEATRFEPRDAPDPKEKSSRLWLMAQQAVPVYAAAGE